MSIREFLIGKVKNHDSIAERVKHKEFKTGRVGSGKSATLVSNLISSVIRSLPFAGLILAAAALRLFPHLPNFSPITGVALFGGAFFAGCAAQSGADGWKRFVAALLAPLATLFVSDLVLGFHAQVPAVYASYALIAALGFSRLEVRSAPTRIAANSLAGSLIFFALVNFSVWAEGGLYPRTGSGLIACYVAGLPFLQNALVGDLFYSAVLFGGWALIEKLAENLAPRFRAAL